MIPFEVLFAAVTTLAIATAFILFVYITFNIIKKVVIKIALFALNSLGGVICLLVLVYVFGLDIPVNLATLFVSMVFGLAGVGTLIILSVTGLV